MEKFIMDDMPKVYFGEGVLNEAFTYELKSIGDNVMIAYGGGSIKRTGVYDKVISLLNSGLISSSHNTCTNIISCFL